LAMMGVARYRYLPRAPSLQMTLCNNFILPIFEKHIDKCVEISYHEIRKIKRGALFVPFKM